MKKIISVVLCAVITLLSVSFLAQATEKEKVTPAILITGYATCSLYKDYGTRNQKQVWVFDFSKILPVTVKDTKNLIPALKEAVVNDNLLPLGRRIGAGGGEILVDMYCNPYDGSSKANVTAYPNDPEISSVYYLKRHKSTELTESQLADELSAELGEKNVFIFHYDWRMSPLDIAADLRQYISDVLRYTGAKKTQLFGLSFGGLIAGTYLSLYGTEAKVDNAVLSVPALRGTKFARMFIEGEVDLPVSAFVQMIECVLGTETDLQALFADADPKAIEKIATGFLTEIRTLPLDWCAFWSLVTPEDYTELKKIYLDKNKNAELIRKSDIIHYDIMNNYKTNFAKARKAGTKISILCSATDISTAFGGDEIGDILLEVKEVSGAKVAKLGKHFPDGYKSANTSCSNSRHNHVSPSMDIDASTAYLPENTWFVSGQYHGCYAFNEQTLGFVRTLMLADKEINVRSNPGYPQFISVKDPTLGVDVRFNNSVPGYVCKDDSRLVITNISGKYPLIVKKITVEGIDISFSLKNAKVILPGKSAEFDFSGSLPKINRKYFSVKVDFAKPSGMVFKGSRTVGFSVLTK